jgi:hypothetical protein
MIWKEGTSLMEDQKSTLDERLAAYVGGPGQLRVALAGLTDAELDVALAADTWTIRQIVHHIVDGDDLWKTCIKAALGNPEGIFGLQWYWDRPQVAWAERWGYAARAIEPSLALFEANRRHIEQLLRGSPDAWERSITVRWPDGQAQVVTAGWVVEMQTRHVTGHIADILEIRSHR